jgi:hypothetical protein
VASALRLSRSYLALRLVSNPSSHLHEISHARNSSAHHFIEHVGTSIFHRTTCSRYLSVVYASTTGLSDTIVCSLYLCHYYI